MAHKLKLGLVVYAISSVILYIGPALLLWNVYREEVAGLCSSLTTVDPSSTRLTSTPSKAHRTRLIFVIAEMALLVIGILAAIIYRS